MVLPSDTTNQQPLLDGQNLDISQQPWYWGSASKEEIATAIGGCPSGTFCVRDASTRGDYTLTVRIHEKNKLVKIIVLNGRCGFTTDSLRFSSVVELIEYYERNSLVEYNHQLTTVLAFPLAKPSTSRTIWENDGVHSANHLLCQLSGLHAGHSRLISYYDQIYSEIEMGREELLRKRQALAAFRGAHSLFLMQTEILRKNRGCVEHESDLAKVDVNIEEQLKRSGCIAAQQIHVEENIKELEKQISEKELLCDDLKPKLSKLHAERDICQFRLCQQHVSRAAIDKVMQEVLCLRDSEPDRLSHILMQLKVKWQPDRWLTDDCSKEHAMKIVRTVMDCNPQNSSGVFLIRPSESKSDHYALTVSNENRIYNCLIEYRDVKHPESCGYAFLNTKLFFPTLVDLVRYYNHCSMKEHNSELDTRLRIPAFKGTL